MGWSTLLMAKRVGTNGTVIASEPFDYYREMLNKNVAINDYKNVIISEAAFFDRDGQMRFELSTGQVVIDKGDASITTITCERLDSYTTRLSFPKIDFIKMDIEGGEMNCLIGMEEVIARDKPKLMIEVHSKLLPRFNHTAGDVIRFLEERSYTIQPFGISRARMRDAEDSFHMFAA